MSSSSSSPPGHSFRCALTPKMGLPSFLFSLSLSLSVAPLHHFLGAYLSLQNTHTSTQKSSSLSHTLSIPRARSRQHAAFPSPIVLFFPSTGTTPQGGRQLLPPFSPTPSASSELQPSSKSPSKTAQAGGCSIKAHPCVTSGRRRRPRAAAAPPATPALASEAPASPLHLAQLPDQSAPPPSSATRCGRRGRAADARPIASIGIFEKRRWWWWWWWWCSCPREGQQHQVAQSDYCCCCCCSGCRYIQ